MAAMDEHCGGSVDDGGPMPELAPVRHDEELDWAALEGHLRANLPELTGPLRVLQFPNGGANLTYLLRFGERELVLRRPPFGVVAPGAHDMKREHKVLSMLWRVFDRAPRAYLFCDERSVIGSDFVVMERRVGEVIRGRIPESMARHPDVARRISFALVDAVADLHLLDPAAAGLASLGRPEGFVERQVTGWRARWDLVRPDDGPPEMDTVPVRLLGSLPPPTRVSLVHNDLKLDNCQFDPATPDRVQSIFDWDMTTVGEPLVDLGTLLNYWPDPSDPAGTSRATHDGMLQMGLPTRVEMVQRYAEQTGLDTTSVPWYEAFAQWKTGVIVQQLHRRWERGESADPRMATVAERIPRLASTAARLLDELRP